MKLGIIGLPNVGKSTLFNALTNTKAETANYQFSTITANVGTVNVPDERLGFLARLNKSEKTVPAFIEFSDIAGLVQGASKGEGLGNKFLASIREADAVVHVVRCFEDEKIIHISDTIDPARDVDIINMELIYADMELAERRVERAKKAQKNDGSAKKEAMIFGQLLEVLNDGRSARSINYAPEDLAIVESCPLLSRKKIIYAANVGEDDIAGIENGGGSAHYNKLKELAKAENAEIIPVCAKIEAEINELAEAERSEFLRELGISKSGLEKLIQASYRLLGLVSYLTSGPKETKAWTIKKGAKAPEAAGKIHSDIEKGFIRAETVAYSDLFECGTMAAAKEKGLVRSEGKEYTVEDGDVILFRFNV